MASQQTGARPISSSDLQQALGLMGSLPAGNLPADQINLFTQLLGSQLLGGQLLNNQQQGQERNGGNGDRLAGGGGAGGRPTRSSDSRSSSAYASRHQAAEQRRRTRINERLDLLRKMVPHAERANTACFLEEVIKYIDTLKKRNADLEKQLLAARNGMHGNGAMANLSGPANAAVTAAAAALAAAAADAHQQMAAQQQQQQQQQQPSTSGGANGNMSVDGGAGGSRDLSGSPPPGAGGMPRLSASALAALQPSAVLAAAMRMGEGAAQGNYSAFLEQALLQGALSHQAQQHVSRLANLASGSGQPEQQQPPQEEKKRAPYGSTLPPELQKLLHEAPADDAGNGLALHGQHDAAMMLAPAGLPHVSGSGGQQRHGSADGGSPMSSEESGAPQKKRKVLQG